MESRALIIAIQQYSEAQGLFTQTLAGTHEPARLFYQWLLSAKNVRPESVFICSDGEIAADHPTVRPNRAGQANNVRLVRGGSRSDIVAAVLDLIDLAQDDTDELFVFFSGHGFAYRQSPWRLALDVLLGSDFRSFRESGAACIKLDELRVRLCTCLGGKDHYFFIDACRNVIDEAQFQAVGLGISPSTAQLGTPTVYTMYSVKYGEPAPINPKFCSALLKGLQGDGHAKGWVQGEMYVKFDLLRDYVKEQVKPRQIDYKQDGDGKGTLLRLPPPVVSRCDIAVVDASPQQKFDLQVNLGTSPLLTTSFIGSSYTTSLEPNDRTYALRVADNGETLEQFDPPVGTPIDMYTNTAVKFRHTRPPQGIPPSPPAAGPLGKVEVVFAPDQTFAGTPPQWAVQLRNLRSGELIEGGTEIREAVPPGKYMAKLLENGVTVVKTTFDVSPGEKKRMDLLSREPTPFQQAFLDRIVGRTDARVPDFSETLGPTANWNPELWLAYLGAAHVLRDPGMYQRLGKIPLESLDDLNDGDSSLFVLASVDGPVPEVALSKGKNVQWVSMETVSGIPTLCQAKIPISSGATLFSIKFADLTPISYATCGLPNRVTLLIICKQPDAPPTVQQFLLTPARFQNHLPIELQWKSLPVSALKVVQFMSLAQTRFAQRKSVGPKQESKDSSVATAIWRTLLDAKWTDPILAVVALYDIVRQGSAKSSPYSVQSVLGNLERYFLDLPDVGILHRLLLKTSAPINGTPLFLEGLLASREASNTMALSPDRLDFNSVWTSWRDAVQGEELSASATLSASWS